MVRNTKVKDIYEVLFTRFMITFFEKTVKKKLRTNLSLSIHILPKDLDLVTTHLTFCSEVYSALLTELVSSH